MGAVVADLTVIVRYGHGAVGLTGWGVFFLLVIACLAGRS